MSTTATEIQKRRVLVVDDEPNIAIGILKTLGQNAHYFAKHAPSGDLAVELMKKEPYDLVITDIKMPNSKYQGIDLLRHIRTTYPEVGVIIMTAYGSTAVQEEASRRGSLLYLEKPFEFSHLQKVVDDFFERREKTEQAPPVDSEAGVQGVIPGLSLMDVIQMNCLSRATCTFLIQKSDGSGQGIICFNKGDITHSETPNRSGKDAFFEIVSWQGGSFETLDQIPPTVTIVESWEQLMMEAVMMMPDAPVSTEAKKAAPAKPVAAAPKAPVDLDPAKMLDRVLDGAKAEAAFLVTHSGFMLDKRVKASFDIAKSGDEISKLLPGIFSFGKSIAGANLQEITFRFAEKTVMVRNVQESEALFVVVSPSSVAAGEIFKAIDRESATLKKIL